MKTLIKLCENSDFFHEICLRVEHPEDPKKSIIVIKGGDKFYAYENICPHFSVQLDYKTGVFSTYKNKLIMCAHHSAMFDITTGLCVDGPCKGHSLTMVKVEVKDGAVFLKR
ncbi:Rieske (2Fe-2S) protein [Acinetobacter calcoaceticus]|uniref:Rieske (2Fe-2S) protein n=1 Tax=Acinetobacter calcoaceticus TaxID=471 RepID=UPI001E2ECDC0|nr:Rieske 2Fe-2S domain-containing protein [Acinetobacter calcoaceticus]UGQ30857.1 Rieske 2Fe-2S domain-containing protein [Acinetobacter calcoaceticus]